MKKNLCFVVSIIILSLFSFGIEIEIIKDPKPTCFEKNVQYEPLKKYKEISNEDDESETFIALARSVTADRSGNIFLFDGVFCEIFKYDKNLVFQGRFGRKGKGPGEFATNRGSGAILNISGKNRLYAQDYKNRRITVFSLKGDYITDYKTEYKYTFNPVQDAEGNLYIPSENSGVVDIFTNKMKLIGVLLDVNEFRRFLFLDPRPLIKINHSFPVRSSLRYCSLKDGRLLVYILNSSTLYLLENRKLKKKFSIWPEKILRVYKKELFDLYQLHDDDVFLLFAVNFFLDCDDNNFFYLQFPEDKTRRIVPIYKFDLDGGLKKILYIKRTKGQITIFQCKKNNIFYAAKHGSVVLYK